MRTAARCISASRRFVSSGVFGDHVLKMFKTSAAVASGVEASPRGLHLVLRERLLRLGVRGRRGREVHARGEENLARALASRRELLWRAQGPAVVLDRAIRALRRLVRVLEFDPRSLHRNRRGSAILAQRPEVLPSLQGCGEAVRELLRRRHHLVQRSLDRVDVPLVPPREGVEHGRPAPAPGARRTRGRRRAARGRVAAAFADRRASRRVGGLAGGASRGRRPGGRPGAVHRAPSTRPRRPIALARRERGQGRRFSERNVW